jgi:hypothetical protein
MPVSSTLRVVRQVVKGMNPAEVAPLIRGPAGSTLVLEVLRYVHLLPCASPRVGFTPAAPTRRCDAGTTAALEEGGRLRAARPHPVARGQAGRDIDDDRHTQARAHPAERARCARHPAPPRAPPRRASRLRAPHAAAVSSRAQGCAGARHGSGAASSWEGARAGRRRAQVGSAAQWPFQNHYFKTTASPPCCCTMVLRRVRARRQRAARNDNLGALQLRAPRARAGAFAPPPPPYCCPYPCPYCTHVQVRPFPPPYCCPYPCPYCTLTKLLFLEQALAARPEIMTAMENPRVQVPPRAE